jgi:hypothetical protein
MFVFALFLVKNTNNICKLLDASIYTADGFVPRHDEQADNKSQNNFNVISL